VTKEKAMTKRIEEKQPTLVEELRATIERAEALHAEIYQRDKPAGTATYVGTRWSEQVIAGAGFGGVQSVARDAAKGIFATCAREIGTAAARGGCGGRGFHGDEERSVCGVCSGTGKILTAAGVEFLRAIMFALAPQVKPDAMPEAIEAHNAHAADARRQREEAQERQAERARQERALLADTAEKIARLRGEGAPQLLDDPVMAAAVKERFAPEVK
jgi:hypothetical protein